jgi:hypothetical protein
MHRWMALLLLATAVGSLSFGSAASLRVSSNDLSGGVYQSSIVLLACSLDDATVSIDVGPQTEQGNAVEPSRAVGATIAGGAASCIGERVVVTAFDADGGVLSQAFGLITGVDGSSTSLALEVDVPANLIASLDLALAR